MTAGDIDNVLLIGTKAEMCVMVLVKMGLLTLSCIVQKISPRTRSADRADMLITKATFCAKLS
jgi:hypothetical protein